MVSIQKNCHLNVPLTGQKCNCKTRCLKFIVKFFQLQSFSGFPESFLHSSLSKKKLSLYDIQCTFSPNYSKCTLNHTTNDPVTARATLTIARKGASYGLIQTVKPRFIAILSSLSLIHWGLWNEKKRMEIFN